MKILITILMATSIGYTAPAYDGEITFEQHDGHTFKGHLKGDEYFSWVEDNKGNIVVYNDKSKDYEHAKLSESYGSIELLPSGISITKTAISKSAPTLEKNKDKKITKDILSKIWKRKRTEEVQ